MENKDREHPQYKRDRELLNDLLEKDIDKLKKEKKSDRALADLARLKIRYRNFPGARDIQRDLQETMKKWKLDEETLYQETRKIHAKGKVYREESNEQDDWV